MTGFNRRFSPAIQRARQLLAGRRSPLIVNYRMNAGYIPPDSWVHGAEGGGRNIGEACHIYDLFAALTGARPVAIDAQAISTPSRQWQRNDNFIATIRYSDGSVCSLTYTALGAKIYPKERMEIFCDGMIVALDDYRALTISGRRASGWRASAPQKGQFEELVELGSGLSTGAWPIALSEQLEVTRAALEIERQLRSPQSPSAEEGHSNG